MRTPRRWLADRARIRAALERNRRLEERILERLSTSEVDKNADQRDHAIARTGSYEHVVSRIKADAAEDMGLLAVEISEYTVARAVADEYRTRGFRARVHGNEDRVEGEHDASGGYIDYHQAYIEVTK